MNYVTKSLVKVNFRLCRIDYEQSLLFGEIRLASQKKNKKPKLLK